VVGVAEDLLVQEIAVSYWRSARALRCERGEVTLGSRIPLERSNLSEPAHLSLEPQSDSDTRNSLLGTSRGLNYLLKKVEEARIEAKSTGYVSKESIKFLSLNSGQSWNGFSGKQALLTALEDEKADINARKLPSRRGGVESEKLPP